MKTFEKLMEEHLKWTSSTFPKGTSHGAALHAEREIKELLAEIEKDGKIADFAFEIVDVMGCIIDCANRRGIRPELIKAAFELKLMENKSRKWKDNGDGSYSHIKS
jgi:hypothetical protein